MRLTASCEIKVRNIGRSGGSVALEVRQGRAGGEGVTTLLLCPDGALELASALLRHAGGARAGGDEAAGRGHKEEVRAAGAS